MRHLVADLERIPGAVAVTLGGSRATGPATADSDWDFGLYHRDLDPAAGVARITGLFAAEWV